MLRVQVLTMIALWCGTPINQTKGGIGFKSGVSVKTIQVKACRKKMIKCALVRPTLDRFPVECLHHGPFN